MGRALRHLLAGFALSLALLLPLGSGVAQGAPADRAAALALYESIDALAATDPGWTGSTATCDAGTESAASLQATLDTINGLRDFAGMGPVVFDAAKNADAREAALMMRAKNELSHDPDPGWPCYSEAGDRGAGTANLALGFPTGPAAMIGYTDDAGVDSLGHRLWLLNPGAMEFGSGTTDRTNALVVLGSYGDGSRRAALAEDHVSSWPPPGWVPWPWIFEDWSASIGNPDSQGATDLSGATVTARLDGTPVPVSGVTDLGTGFGIGKTLKWKLALPDGIDAADHEIAIEIGGVTVNGNPTPISYVVKAFAPAAAPGGGGDDDVSNDDGDGGAGDGDPGGPSGGDGDQGAESSPACAKAEKKLERAKRKLRKAKQSGSKRKLRKAKKQVKRAKKRVRRAC